MILWKSKKRNRWWWPVIILASIISHQKREDLLEEYLPRMASSNFKVSRVRIYLGWGRVAWILVLLCHIWLIGLRWICLVMICRRIVRWCQRMGLFSHQWRCQGRSRLLFSRHRRVSRRFQFILITQGLISWSHYRLHQRSKLPIHRTYSWARAGIS